jgi:hypothetical protein
LSSPSIADGPAIGRCFSSDEAVVNVGLWHESSDNAMEDGNWCEFSSSGISFSSSDQRLVSGDDVACLLLSSLLALAWALALALALENHSRYASVSLC